MRRCGKRLSAVSFIRSTRSQTFGCYESWMFKCLLKINTLNQTSHALTQSPIVHYSCIHYVWRRLQLSRSVSVSAIGHHHEYEQNIATIHLWEMTLREWVVFYKRNDCQKAHKHLFFFPRFLLCLTGQCILRLINWTIATKMNNIATFLVYVYNVSAINGWLQT